MIMMAELTERGAITGYEMLQYIPNTAHQQIYRDLNKLERLGYIYYELVPQEKRPDKKVYRVAKTEHAKNFFNDAIRQLPINYNIPVKSLEGMKRIVKHASYDRIIPWCRSFIRVYRKAKIDSGELGMNCEMMVRKVMIDYARMIIKLAILRRRREQAQTEEIQKN